MLFRSISANQREEREDEDDIKDGILRHLKGQFQSYSKLGDRRSDGSHITMGQSDKWLKQVCKQALEGISPPPPPPQMNALKMPMEFPLEALFGETCSLNPLRILLGSPC